MVNENNTKTKNGITPQMTINILLSVIIFFLLIGTCTNMSVNKRVKETHTYIESDFIKDINTHDSLLIEQFITANALQNITLREGMSNDFDISLYNFLIYEDDLDKGKISLSEIKNLLLVKKNQRDYDANKGK